VDKSSLGARLATPSRQSRNPKTNLKGDWLLGHSHARTWERNSKGMAERLMLNGGCSRKVIRLDVGTS
jgi:hypothetical protein